MSPVVPLSSLSSPSSVWKSWRQRGQISASRGEIRGEPNQWMDKPAVGESVWQSDNYTGPSLNYILRNVPQSNITEPNNSNVFGNLWEKQNCRYTWRSVCLNNSLRPHSDRVRQVQFTDGDDVMMSLRVKTSRCHVQDVCWVRISITTHYNSIHVILNCQ